MLYSRVSYYLQVDYCPVVVLKSCLFQGLIVVKFLGLSISKYFCWKIIYLAQQADQSIVIQICLFLSSKYLLSNVFRFFYSVSSPYFNSSGITPQSLGARLLFIPFIAFSVSVSSIFLLIPHLLLFSRCLTVASLFENCIVFCSIFQQHR